MTVIVEIIADNKGLSSRDINVLSSYLKEMRTSTLISAQEELLLGKDVMDEEGKKRSLTQRWMVLFSHMVKKNNSTEKRYPGKKKASDSEMAELDKILELFCR